MGQARDKAIKREDRVAMAIERERLIQEEKDRVYREEEARKQALKKDRYQKDIAAREWLDLNHELVIKEEVDAKQIPYVMKMDCDIDDVKIFKNYPGRVNVEIVSHNVNKEFTVKVDDDGDVIVQETLDGVPLTQIRNGNTRRGSNSLLTASLIGASLMAGVGMGGYI